MCVLLLGCGIISKFIFIEDYKAYYFKELLLSRIYKNRNIIREHIWIGFRGIEEKDFKEIGFLIHFHDNLLNYALFVIIKFMIGIIDYGAGNIRSIVNAIVKASRDLGIDVIVSSDLEILSGVDKLILPGVGAFGDVMKNLKSNSLDEFVKNWIRKGNKFMGICVGLQVLFEVGYENGINEGLNIFKGDVVKFSIAKPIPHVGWNQISVLNESPFFSKRDEGKYFYFVHSYYVKPKDEKLINTTTEYNGEIFTSSIFCENVFGVQFHPEKSHKNGEDIIKKFLKNF
ncbi:MAG: imidazole glycerol phosphate synthase subunit HisH [Brevinematia bacterium]